MNIDLYFELEELKEFFDEMQYNAKNKDESIFCENAIDSIDFIIEILDKRE